eukprot:scpid98206/ scgid18601/ 
MAADLSRPHVCDCSASVERKNSMEVSPSVVALAVVQRSLRCLSCPLKRSPDRQHHSIAKVTTSTYLVAWVGVIMSTHVYNEYTVKTRSGVIARLVLSEYRYASGTVDT